MSARDRLQHFKADHACSIHYWDYAAGRSAFEGFMIEKIAPLENQHVAGGA